MLKQYSWNTSRRQSRAKRTTETEVLVQEPDRGFPTARTCDYNQLISSLTRAWPLPRLGADEVAPWGLRRPMYRRQIRVRCRVLFRRWRIFVYHNVLHADDPPHRLALGAAIGVFVTFTPTVGFQMMINVFLAWLLRANKAIGLPIVWISNPATIVPIYYACYVLGRFMLGWQAVSEAWWKQLARPPAGWWPTVEFYWSRLVEIAAPLWLGSVVIGLLLAYPTYYSLYHIIRTYRLRRWGQLLPPKFVPGGVRKHKPAANTLADEGPTSRQ